jgi:hypothetical protein
MNLTAMGREDDRQPKASAARAALSRVFKNITESCVLISQEIARALEEAVKKRAP